MLSDADFDSLFTTNRPVIFAYHGYPWLIHRLTYRRTNHANLDVSGYKEEGTTTPFDLVVRNELGRFYLAIDVIDRVPGPCARAAYAKQAFREALIRHHAYIREYGDDLREIRDWRWTGPAAAAEASGPRGRAAG